MSPDQTALVLFHREVLLPEITHAVNEAVAPLRDRLTVIEKRLKTYHEQTEPLKDYYEERGLLRRFDGTRDKTEVHDHIRATLATLRLEERL